MKATRSELIQAAIFVCLFALVGYWIYSDYERYEACVHKGGEWVRTASSGYVCAKLERMP